MQIVCIIPLNSWIGFRIFVIVRVQLVSTLKVLGKVVSRLQNSKFEFEILIQARMSNFP